MKPVVYAADDATKLGLWRTKAGALDVMGEYQTQKRKERSELDVVIRGLTRAREHLLKHHDELKRGGEERRRKRDELTNKAAALVTKHWFPDAGREFPPPKWEVLTDLITEVKGELGRFVDTENTVDEVRRMSWAAQDEIVYLEELLKCLEYMNTACLLPESGWGCNIDSVLEPSKRRNELSGQQLQ